MVGRRLEKNSKKKDERPEKERGKKRKSQEKAAGPLRGLGVVDPKNQQFPM